MRASFLTRALVFNFDDYQNVASVSRPGIGGRVAVIFRKDLDLMVSSIVQDPEIRSKAIDKSNNEIDVFRMGAAYELSGSKPKVLLRIWKPF